MVTREKSNTGGLLESLGYLLRDADHNRALDDQYLDTEAPLRYRLENMEFVDHTRVTRLSFVKIRTYRTVERYIQRNNQKYKIYTDWRTKETALPAISLKLTNDVLENLSNPYYLVMNDIVKKSENADLISESAFNILHKLIVEFGNSHLMPSWMEKELLAREMQKKIDALEYKIVGFNNAIQAGEDKIRTLEFDLAELKERVRKITDARQNKFLFVLLSVITLGIYAFFNSQKQLDEFAARLAQSEQGTPLEIDSINGEIKRNSAQIKRRSQDIEEIRADYTQRIDRVEPLLEYVTDDTAFMPLKNLAGMKYKKIKGVYIIRNRELDKAYVGQSKDVLKRLKDHFTGTEPKNIIFAEDYYKSKLENKYELFEYKIEELDTKDELDKREMELIAQYDSFNSGYNKTAGNA